MEELDLLKKSWKKDEHTFDQVSEVELYKMLHKKSSSIVKWIFIISVLEFLFGIMLSAALSFTKGDENNLQMIKDWGLYDYYVTSTLLIYAIVFYFIYRFYSMYQKISVIDNTKLLITSILKTRKVVKQYIAFNLTTFAIIFIIVGGFGFYYGYTEGAISKGNLNPEMPLNVMLIAVLVLIVVTAILTFVFWLIYKLIYGILLKRLNKNYEELRKIDF